MVVKPLEHTADVGFEIEAESVEGLFQGALLGLLGTMFQNPPQEGQEEVDLALEAPDLESLLVRFLNELVYLIQTRGQVPGEAHIALQGGGEGFRLWANLRTVPFGKALGFQGEVKAATYHGLEVREEGGRFKARVILDV